MGRRVILDSGLQETQGVEVIEVRGHNFIAPRVIQQLHGILASKSNLSVAKSTFEVAVQFCQESLSIAVSIPALLAVIEKLAQVVLQRLHRGEEPVETIGGGYEGELHRRVDESSIGQDTNGQLSVHSRADGDQELERLIHDLLSLGVLARLDVFVVVLERLGRILVVGRLRGASRRLSPMLVEEAQ